MDSDSHDIYQLITKNLIGSISVTEKIFLDNWVNKNEKNKSEYNQVVELWKKSGNISFPSQIRTSKALKIVHNKLRLNSFGKTKRIIFQIAAVLFLAIFFSAGFNYFFGNKRIENTTVYSQEIHAAYGTTSNINLPDGSTVFLNSGSTLRFSSIFSQQNQRNVELIGEGFFKVAKDSFNPFIVSAGGLDIKVLGTKFNVNAYESDSETKIVLVEGKVAIQKSESKSNDKQIELKPNQIATFNLKENKLYKQSAIDLEKYIGWTEGKIVFIDDPIQEVIKRLKNWYNVDLQIDDNQLLNYRFTGTFINESLEEILTILCLTSPMQYVIEPSVKGANEKFSKRKIILRSK